MSYSQEELLEKFGEELMAKVVEVKDFPKPRVTYLDLNQVYADSLLMVGIATHLGLAIRDCDYLIAPDARGFVMGGTLAVMQGCGFVPARKKGNLPEPYNVVKYEAEYSTGEFHLPQVDLTGKKVSIFDDVIATGGTVDALVKYIKEQGGTVVDILSIINIGSLREGSAKDTISGHRLITLVHK